MSEAEIQKILNDPNRVQCSFYNANLSREDCLKRHKNALGWDRSKRKNKGLGWFLGSGGSHDPNCLKCKQGRKIKKDLERGRNLCGHEPKSSYSKNKHKPSPIPKKEANPMEGFEMYKTGRKINNSNPMIYCLKENKIYFNSAAVRTFPIKKFKGVFVFYNKEKKIIGIQLTNDDSIKGYLRICYSSKYAGGFSATGFLKEYNLKPFGQIPLVKSDLAENFYTAELPVFLKSS